MQMAQMIGIGSDAQDWRSSGKLGAARLQQALASFFFAFDPAVTQQSRGSGAHQRSVASPRIIASTDATMVLQSTEAEAPPKLSRGSEGRLPSVSFSHVHAYVDSLKPLQEYKLLETKLNALTRAQNDTRSSREEWLKLSELYGDPVTGLRDPAAWIGSKQDVVEQLLVGLGWRITGKHKGLQTTSLVVSSPAEDGVKLIFTTHNSKSVDGKSTSLTSSSRVPEQAPDPYSSEHIERFADHRSGREGFAVLAFHVAPGDVELIRRRYADKHPKLLLRNVSVEYGGFKILDVFAYYLGETGNSDEDRGTLLRFMEPSASRTDINSLPGMETVEAEFDQHTLPVYCDHWVSNVVSRTGFIDILNDTLGFTPKVDFNAGVVAAGEAQIESTVAGNDLVVEVNDVDMALRSQAQVYLPINNAISKVGHVQGYLDEIGQGIQHIASRVKDLPALVQRANDMREITGAGLSFLSIPPSYYGSLSQSRMVQDLGMDANTAAQYITTLKNAGVLSASDTVDIDVGRERVAACLPSHASAEEIEYVMRARYSNLYALLRDSIDEDAYLSIVRNQILVDVQGGDLLMQIFTAPVLQREPGQEAPFFEFIQRVCSGKKDPSTGKQLPIKPGCGGFGIRNFLTLFLSIEVSKAGKLREDAVLAGRHIQAAYYSQMVDAFTRQLEESNPVLTLISDAMTKEGEARAMGEQDTAARYKADKEKGQETLMAISTKYKNLMREMRKNAPL